MIPFNQLLFLSSADIIRLIIHQHNLLIFQKISINNSLHQHPLTLIPAFINLRRTSGNHKRLLPKQPPLKRCRLHPLPQITLHKTTNIRNPNTLRLNLRKLLILNKLLNLLLQILRCIRFPILQTLHHTMISRTTGCPRKLFLSLCFLLNKPWNQRNKIRLKINSLLNLLILMITFLFQIRHRNLHRNIPAVLIRIHKPKPLIQFLPDSGIHHFLTIPVLQKILLHLSGRLIHNLRLRQHLRSNTLHLKLGRILIKRIFLRRKKTNLLIKRVHASVSCQSRQNIIQIIFPFQPGLRRKKLCLIFTKMRKADQLFIQIGNSTCQNHFLLCTGQGNVKHTDFLPQTFLQKLTADHLLIQGRNHHSPVRQNRICSKTIIRMNQKFCIQVLEIELFSHSRKDHNRKFQSFTFVDCHDFHRTFPCTGKVHLAVIHLVFLQMFNIANKVKQAAIAGFLVIHGFFHQHGKIGASLCTIRQGLGIIAVSCSSQNFKNQFMNRSINCQIPHFI